MFSELDDLFSSPTIKPTFEVVHVILALYIFGENRDGIGRYRLEKELLIGSGTAKSLIRKLNEDIGFITRLDQNKRKGHVLTEKGLSFLSIIKKSISLIHEGDSSLLKEIIIKPEKDSTCFSLVKNAAAKITDGIAQRDAAIKIEGSGATCLVFDGENLVFPSKYLPGQESDLMILGKEIQAYFEKLLALENLNLEENDVVVIGSGETFQKARLSAVNAVLTLL
jgi:predicted transcriptional regulator